MNLIAVLAGLLALSTVRADQFPSVLLGKYEVTKNIECSHRGDVYDPNECLVESVDGFLTGNLELFQFTSGKGEVITSFVEDLPYSQDQVNLQDFDSTNANGFRAFGKIKSVSPTGFKYIEGYSQPDGVSRTTSYEVDEVRGTYSNIVEGVDSHGTYIYVRRFKIAR